MSVAPSTGSPLQRHTAGSKEFTNENSLKHSHDNAIMNSQDAFSTLRKGVVTLATSKFANQAVPKPIGEGATSPTVYPMDTLLAKLSEQQAVIREQSDTMKRAETDSAYSRAVEQQTSCNPVSITPAADGLDSSSSAAPKGSIPSSDELLRLKLELAQAHNQITRLDQELIQSRISRPDSSNMMMDTDFAAGPSFERAISHPMEYSAPGNAIKPLYARDNIWSLPEGGRPDTTDASITGTIGRARGIWRSDLKQPRPQNVFPTAPGPAPMANSHHPHPPSVWPAVRSSSQSFVDPTVQAYGDMASAMDDGRSDRLAPDNDLLLRPSSRRRGNRFDNPIIPGQSFSGFGIYGSGQAQFDANNDFPGGGAGHFLNASMFPQYQQQPIGTPLSPHATEFTTETAPSWKNESQAVVSDVQTFVPTTEPLNYRRLLDRNVNCNWKYIVDKIVCSNDQQASIFLQQKLKVGTVDQKYDIVEAIVAQAYPLMINRFGNFLVQRCFEHGTPDQITKIADAIRGSTLSLSMDPFGCHVVQKAFDSVPEDYKAIMVHELLRRIPETVIHRYACHVWQKLFELRWNDSPPQIMKYVNEALRGMWHEVALGETGSLVVQNIFENCLEEDKRPCIEEVLSNIDVVAHGQFGNWCIQHVCEHGAPNDRGRAIDHVITYAAEYSMDQFASKVVEKCLKIGGTEFLDRYLDHVCEGRVDRPRIPLIDIASDQYGNYLIQYILTHASPQHREIVAAHIRKHMVSLRGSKFGSRVGMLCTNPAVATRPGPGAGPSVGRLPPRYGGYR